MFTNPAGLSRRALLGASLAAAGGVSLGACSLGGASGGSEEGFAQPEGDVPGEYADRIRVVIWSPFPGNMGDPIQASLTRFNESQADIFAEAQFFADHDEIAQQLSRGIQARTVPDLAVLDAIRWYPYLLNGTLEPLDDHLAAAGTGVDDYADAFAVEGVRKDQLWWLSFSRTTAVLYYNRDAFAEAGLPDRAPETWTEFREWGESLQGLTIDGRQPKVFAHNGGLNHWNFQGTAWAWGGGISAGLDITVGAQEAVEGAAWNRQWIDDQMAYQAIEAIDADFFNQTTLALVTSGGSLSSFQEQAPFNLGVAQVPMEVDYGTPTGGAGVSMLANIPTSRKQAAGEVLAFLTSPEETALFSTATGYLPVNKGAVDTDAYADLIEENPDFQTLVDQLEIARPVDRVLVEVPGTWDQLNTAIQGLYEGDGGDAESVLGVLSDDMNRLLEEQLPAIEEWES